MEPIKKTMAAQNPDQNNGGGGMENPAEAAEIATWMAHFTGALVAAGKESMLAVMRGQWRPAAMCGGAANHGTRPNDHNMQMQPTATDHTMKTETETNKKCELCKVQCTSSVMIKEHESGKRHQKNLRKSQKPEATNNDDPSPNTTIQQPTEITKKKNPKCKKKDGICKRDIKPETDEELGKTEPSKKQKSEKNQSEMPFRCYICSVKCNGKEAFDRHLCGKKHKSKVRSHWTKERTVVGLQAVYPPPQIAGGASASSSLNGFS